MSTEVKKEGETKDNTQKKKELEDKIAKQSIKGTDESLKCFEELKELNKTLNDDKSITDLPQTFETIFPKFDDHSFTKIRNAVLKSREIKGGSPEETIPHTAYAEAISDEGPGSVYIFDMKKMLPGFSHEPLIQEINRLIDTKKQYIMVKVLSNTNSTLNIEIPEQIAGIEEEVYSILVLKNELDKTIDSTDKTLGSSLKDLIDTAICNSERDQGTRSSLFQMFLAQDDWIPES